MSDRLPSASVVVVVSRVRRREQQFVELNENSLRFPSVVCLSVRRPSVPKKKGTLHTTAVSFFDFVFFFV